MTDNLEDEAIAKQKDLCIKYKVDFCLSALDSIIGVALDTFNQLKTPINGLRHTIENDTVANWYIWAGEYSSANDFFRPIHVRHLIEICPKAMNYLGLAPGWRFLFDDKYEDVWLDENLILIQKPNDV